MESNFSVFCKTMTPRSKHIPALILLLSFTLLWSCSKGSKESSGSDSAVDSIGAYVQDDSYHADNDIAMTMRSIADALSQGEELDSLDYNYEGILTDGAGHPLYTDVQGTPGIWKINVIDPHKITLSNLYLGDLLPVALESYITQSLGLTEADLVDAPGIIPYDADSIHVYAFKGGYIIFKTHTAITPKGYEGPLMNITVTDSLPQPQ